MAKQRPDPIRSSLNRYSLAVGATSVALAATLILRRYGPAPSFLFFVPAVALSAWYGGIGPSAVATIVSLLLIDLNFFAPGGSLSIDRVEGTEIVAFLIVAITITATMAALHHARALAESHARELKRLNEEVGRSYDAERERRHVAEVVAQAREEVLGVVAHDLRNPLNVIISSTDLLLNEDLDRARRTELLEVALRAGRRMNRLIGDLLDTVRLHAGKLTLDLEDVAVATIFKDADDMFRPLAEKRQISIEIAPAADGLAVRADPLRVSQVLGNILGNALKFTPERGRIVLRASSNGRQVRIDVIDNGPGISASDLEHLFDNFWQAQRNDNRGVGLGLAIAKSVVEAHGGRIWCESTPGKGTTFSFTLPITTIKAANLHAVA
ncbi:MAG TPA: HAMP domain-containing sensor histidine kinase [Gemmatimonadaceae bacterium]|nr:HAMP domain-containing sensor histidine kinase [Gemmatimonadaceae bacterium]